jgi:hypothetical protein
VAPCHQRGPADVTFMTLLAAGGPHRGYLT